MLRQPVRDGQPSRVTVICPAANLLSRQQASTMVYPDVDSLSRQQQQVSIVVRPLPTCHHASEQALLSALPTDSLSHQRASTMSALPPTCSCASKQAPLSALLPTRRHASKQAPSSGLPPLPTHEQARLKQHRPFTHHRRRLDLCRLIAAVDVVLSNSAISSQRHGWSTPAQRNRS